MPCVSHGAVSLQNMAANATCSTLSQSLSKDIITVSSISNCDEQYTVAWALERERAPAEPSQAKCTAPCVLCATINHAHSLYSKDCREASK